MNEIQCRAAIHDDWMLARGLSTALARLAAAHPMQAAAWVLVNLRGLTLQETADLLGVTHQRVSAAAESARKALAKELA